MWNVTELAKYTDATRGTAEWTMRWAARPEGVSNEELQLAGLDKGRIRFVIVRERDKGNLTEIKISGIRNRRVFTDPDVAEAYRAAAETREALRKAAANETWKEERRRKSAADRQRRQETGHSSNDRLFVNTRAWSSDLSRAAGLSHRGADVPIPGSKTHGAPRSIAFAENATVVFPPGIKVQVYVAPGEVRQRALTAEDQLRPELGSKKGNHGYSDPRYTGEENENDVYKIQRGSQKSEAHFDGEGD